jgi:hypothetical protein
MLVIGAGCAAHRNSRMGSRQLEEDFRFGRIGRDEYESRMKQREKGYLG